MSKQPYVVIGGDAAGMSAASKIKREEPEAEVIVFERSPHISYSACGMPYWIGGVLESERQLVVLTPQIARKKRGIDVRIHHEVIAIDSSARLVHVTNHESGETFEQPYAKLLIATGARPLYPPIPGLDTPGVFTLRAFADSHRIHEFMEQSQPRRATIIGGGYIGLEMAEAFRDRGLEVTIVEMQPQIMPMFDEDMVGAVTEHLLEKGVKLHLNTEVKAIRKSEEGILVETTSKDALVADIVLLSVGVRPNSELASAAGLKLGPANAIHIDRRLRTSAPDIFAAGDCAAHYHLVLEQDVWIPLATSANKGGRVAAENMLGGNTTLPGILGTAVVKVFDYTMSNTGLSQREAKGSGLFGKGGEYVGSATIEAKDRANYWPGAADISVKLIFDRRDGRVLGGQLVGKDGVNKRIDIVATAITASMTLEDVTMLDLSYAPPYSTTHDPLQICASVAQRDLLPQPIA
jgi:NADPH-dependent 2,4-dienoyl-CoA reductase/sulfur reductase-like enzyme